MGKRRKRCWASQPSAPQVKRLYDEAASLEYSGSGKPVDDLLRQRADWGAQADRIGCRDIAVTVYYVHAAQLGVPRITLRRMKIVWRWDSAEAFGAGAPDQNSGIRMLSFNQRFPGQVIGAETALNLYRSFDSLNRIQQVVGGQQ